MMDDEADERKASLTSTMDNIPQNVLLSENNDKNDANDSTPTSSTDAASKYSTTSVNASEDPISSTSSDVSEKRKVLAEDTMEIKNENLGVSKSLIGSDSDVDLLDISSVPTEPINEDVEDIVQDLENLLGEAEPTKDYLSIRKKHLVSEVAVDSDLTFLKEEQKTDEVTLEFIQKEDENSDHLNVAQILPEDKQVFDKLNLESTNSKRHEENIEEVPEQTESSDLLFNKQENPPNTEVQKENEDKITIENIPTLVEGIECEIKISEEKKVTCETSSEIEKMEMDTKFDNDASHINLLNVSKKETVEEIVEAEGSSFDSKLNNLNSPTEMGQTSQDITNMQPLESECIVQGSEIDPVIKDQLSVHNKDISEQPLLISEEDKDSVNCQKPISNQITSQSSEAFSQPDDGDSKLQKHLSSKNISPEISYATIEESVDIEEIVKSAVDNVMESSTSSNEVIKSAEGDVLGGSTSSLPYIKSAVGDVMEGSTSSLPYIKSAVGDVMEGSTSPLPMKENEVTYQINSLAEENVDLTEEPLSAISILKDDIKSEMISESEGTAEELTESNTISVVMSSDSPRDEIQTVQTIGYGVSDIEPIASNLPITMRELTAQESERSNGEPIVEKDILMEDKTTLSAKDNADPVTEYQVDTEEITAENKSLTVIENIPGRLTENKTEAHLEEEVNVIIGDNTENIAHTESQTIVDDAVVIDKRFTAVTETYSVGDQSTSFESENKLPIEINIELNVKENAMQDEPELSAKHSSEIVTPNTDTTMDIECKLADQSIKNVQDVCDSNILVEKEGNTEVQKTESVTKDETGELESVLIREDKDMFQASASIQIEEDGTDFTLKDKDILVKDDEVKTVKNELQDIVKDNLEFVENEASSITSNKSELGLPDVCATELQDSCKKLEFNSTQQIVEELSETETTPIEASNFEIEVIENEVKKPEKSCTIQKLDTTEEELKFNSENLDYKNEDIAQVNEISSAITLENAESSEINLNSNKSEILEKSGEIDEIQEKSEQTEKEIERTESHEENESLEQTELEPVKEEFFVKKTIIYEHDCKHERAHHHEKDQKGENELKIIHKCPELEEDVVSNIHDKCDERFLDMKDTILVDHASCSKDISSDSQEDNITEQNYAEDNHNVHKLNVQEENINEPLQSVVEDTVDNKSTQDMRNEVKETEDLEKIYLSDSPKGDIIKEDAETSKVIERTEVQNIVPETPNPNEISDSSLYCNASEKQVCQRPTDESADNLGTEIHDQTTAAVQSILDNMLAEEQNVVPISNKEEAPVVHSSYSSYELQKAVQQIQDIAKTDENEDISSEELPHISNIEKPKEPVEIVQMIAESSEANVEEYKESCVQSIEAESTTLSLPEQNEKIDTFEPQSSADDLVESPEPSFSKNTLDETTYGSKLKDIHIEEIDQEAVKTVSSSQSPGKHVELQSALPNNKKIEVPLVEPSIDLSEESSNEGCSESEHMHDKVSSTCITPEKFEVNIEEKVDVIQKVQSPLKVEALVECVSVKSDAKKSISRETRHSSRISERSKDKLHNTKENIIEPLTINIEEMEKEKNYSPKVAVKTKDDESPDDREEHKGSLKITITKQSDNTHSILKICSPDTELRHKIADSDETGVVPKLVIKTSEADLHSPKMSTRSSKQTLSTNISQKSGSPRITIKPIPKPESREPITSPLKITIKPMGKPEEFSKQQQQKHSPKVTKMKSEDEHYGTRSKILKLSDNSEVVSHKVTIKPIVKPSEDCEQVSTPKITIKPFDKPDSEAKVSPKITIKPVVRPVDLQSEIDDEIKERIVLKINKGTIPSKEIDKANRESRKREHEDDRSEKLAKIKLKFSKGGDAHIVHEENIERRSLTNKRPHETEGLEKNKRNRCDNFDNNSDDDVKIVEERHSPIVISEDSRSQDSVIVIEEGNDGPPVTPKNPVVPVPIASVPKKRGRPRKVPLVVREDFGNLTKEELQPVPSMNVVQTVPLAQDSETSGRPKRSCRGQSVRDTLGMKPRKPKAPSKPRGAKRGSGLKTIGMKGKEGPKFSEGKLELIKRSLTEDAVESAKIVSISKIVSTGLLEKILDRPDPKLEKTIELKGLLEAAKDQNIIEIIEVDTPSSSPKQIESAAQDDLDINDQILVEVIEKHSSNLKTIVEIQCSNNDVSSTRSDLLVKDDVDTNRALSDLGVVDAAGSDVEMQPPTPLFAPPLIEASAMDISQSTDIAMFEEETRMSAEASSRAETPAKQVMSADVVVEESQSSVQSTATTESGKIPRKSRLEVHQEGDGSVVTADQLNEYYWGGNGPFMIQEQVAQFLGIKSFKRKYPTIPRRMVDMQERDYIRENGLASESMCDLGLTAVNSADILDIMYSDFQERYEEFCKFQRDKQAKDLLNKQKALSLAANHERNKLDLVEQAVHSAAAYNANFNRARKEHRKACMDLQSMSVHYPKGKMRQISLPKMGNYPVAVVPGQYTDYYKEFSPTELNNLPINTMLYTELHKILPEVSDSDSDSSGSDSEDSSSSDSDSGSSCGDNCKLCNNHDKRNTALSRKSPIHASV